MTLSGQRFAVKTLLRYWGFPKSKFPLKGRAKWNVAGEEKILEPGEVVYNPLCPSVTDKVYLDYAKNPAASKSAGGGPEFA